MSATIPPIQIYALANWKRTYQVSFANFLEVAAGATIATANVPVVGGITVVGGTPGSDFVPVTISGGVAESSYDGTVQVVLNSGVKVEAPYTYNVVAPGEGGITFLEFPKTPYFDRIYQWPFGEVFDELKTPGNPIVPPAVPTVDAGLSTGTPSLSGTTVLCELLGGTSNGGPAGDGVYSVSMRATLADGTVLSIPGSMVVVDR